MLLLGTPRMHLCLPLCAPPRWQLAVLVMLWCRTLFVTKGHVAGTMLVLSTGIQHSVLENMLGMEVAKCHDSIMCLLEALALIGQVVCSLPLTGKARQVEDWCGICRSRACWTPFERSILMS